MGLPEKSGLKLYSKWKRGKKNKITDVEGVRVAHVTLKDGNIKTGVTAILPHTGNIFRDKPVAGASVINGFGKSLGLVQLKELGNIETPIIMTNTLSVGTAATALTKYMLAQNEDIGVETGTVNCMVTECNDGRLNDIRGFHVKEDHVLQALEEAEKNGLDFEEGAVGAGTGMCCLGFKGGIGSSSRLVDLDGKEYTIGAIVMSNFGEGGNLVIGGDHVGERTKDSLNARMKDKGSIIMILATDIPMSSRQLNRVSKRAAIALGRMGSYMANGSGDICIAFSTSNRMPHYSKDKNFIDCKVVYEDAIDKIFEASVEAIEESIVSALYHAETTEGVRGNTYYSLREYL
jgi:D-aminopeptidase